MACLMVGRLVDPWAASKAQNLVAVKVDKLGAMSAALRAVRSASCLAQMLAVLSVAGLAECLARALAASWVANWAVHWERRRAGVTVVQKADSSV